jgi:uncharacterized protein YggE
MRTGFHGASLWVTSLAILSMGVSPHADSAAQEPDASQATITVTGMGEVLIAPDRATLVVSIETLGATSAAASADNARVHSAVMAALMAAGAGPGAVSTASYSVDPTWKYSNSGPPTRTGYRANTDLRIEVAKLDRIGVLIDAALSAGAARISNLQFDSKDKAHARQQALALAVADARTDAETLARAAGGSLGALEQVSTQAAGTSPGVSLEEITVTGARRAGTYETDVEPKQLQVSAVVLARWAYVPGAR